MPVIFRTRVFLSLDERGTALVQLAARLTNQPAARLAREATLARARDIVRTAGLDPDAAADREAA